MKLIQIALLILFFSGFLIVTYPSYAPKKGLPVGEMLSNETGLIRMLGGLSLFYSLIAVFFYFDWFIALLNIVGLFFTSFITISILKQITQFLCILGLFVGIGLALTHYLFI